MTIEKGRYRRLVESQMRESQLDLATLRELLYGNRDGDEEEAGKLLDNDMNSRDTKGDLARARAMALSDWKYITMGRQFYWTVVSAKIFPVICSFNFKL